MIGAAKMNQDVVSGLYFVAAGLKAEIKWSDTQKHEIYQWMTKETKATRYMWKMSLPIGRGLERGDFLGLFLPKPSMILWFHAYLLAEVKQKLIILRAVFQNTSSKINPGTARRN